MANIQVRALTDADAGLLEQFTSLAVWTPQIITLPSAELRADPRLAQYWQGFGRPGDAGFAALIGRETVGAAWARLMSGSAPGYGHVDDQTPELSIAVVPKWRGKGVGTQLIDALLDALTEAGYQSVSLSVQQANPAVGLYKRFGFTVVRVHDAEYIMVRSLCPIDDSVA